MSDKHCLDTLSLCVVAIRTDKIILCEVTPLSCEGYWATLPSPPECGDWAGKNVALFTQICHARPDTDTYSALLTLCILNFCEANRVTNIWKKY